MQQTQTEALLNNISNEILYIFVSYIHSETLLKNRKLFTLIIYSIGATVYAKICCVVDNKT